MTYLEPPCLVVLNTIPKCAQGQLLPASASTVDVTASMDFSSSLLIDFDNDSDSEATVVTITGPDQHNLLLRVTGALNSLGLSVKSASISVGGDNTVFDVFRVVDSDEKKVCRVLNLRHGQLQTLMHMLS